MICVERLVSSQQDPTVIWWVEHIVLPLILDFAHWIGWQAGALAMTALVVRTRRSGSDSASFRKLLSACWWSIYQCCCGVERGDRERFARDAARRGQGLDVPATSSEIDDRKNRARHRRMGGSP